METTITLFGSSRPSPDSPEYRDAMKVGTALARAGFMICNGGYAGTMEAAARGAKEAGGSTIGVTTEALSRTPNPWIDREIRCATMVERLLKLVELGQAYVIFRGGTGTLLELAAVWEFVNKGMMKTKPIVIVGPFWEPVVSVLKGEELWEGHGDCTTWITAVATPEEAVRELKSRLHV